MTHRKSLQDASALASIKRGVVIDIAVGDGGPVNALRSQILRLENGTWSLLVARLVQPAATVGGLEGRSIARGPGQLNPEWPVNLIISHGRGAATWTELILCAARGTTLVRSDDYMQCQILLGSPAGGLGWPTTDKILLCATQLIVDPMPAHVSETVVVDGGGIAKFLSIPACAQTVQYIGANVPAAVVTFFDSGGAVIGTSPAIAVAASIHLPTNLDAVWIAGLVPGAQVTATYEVLQ